MQFYSALLIVFTHGGQVSRMLLYRHARSYRQDVHCLDLLFVGKMVADRAIVDFAKLRILSAQDRNAEMQLAKPFHAKRVILAQFVGYLLIPRVTNGVLIQRTMPSS